MSTPTTEYRLDTLEAVLAEFIMQQNRNLARMERDTENLKSEMSDFKNEMSDFKNEMSDFKNEMRRNTQEMNKKWGEVTNKLGTFAEDFVAPNIPRIAEEKFNFSSLDFFVRTFDKKNPNDNAQNFEFDVLAVCYKDKKVILTETKFSVRMKYLEGMNKIIENFRVAFPEYQDFELIPIFASMSIAPDQIKYLTSQGIYALALGSENMDLLNFDDLNKN